MVISSRYAWVGRGRLRGNERRFESSSAWGGALGRGDAARRPVARRRRRERGRRREACDRSTCRRGLHTSSLLMRWRVLRPADSMARQCRTQFSRWWRATRRGASAHDRSHRRREAIDGAGRGRRVSHMRLLPGACRPPAAVGCGLAWECGTDGSRGRRLPSAYSRLRQRSSGPRS